MLVPAYKPLLKHSKPVKKFIRIWPEGADSALQDCFVCTGWELFKTAVSQGDQTDIEEYAEAITSYIANCTGDVTVVKTFTTRGNRKLWMNTEVRSLLTAQDTALKGCSPLSQACALKRD